VVERESGNNTLSLRPSDKIKAALGSQYSGKSSEYVGTRSLLQSLGSWSRSACPKIRWRGTAFPAPQVFQIQEASEREEIFFCMLWLGGDRLAFLTLPISTFKDGGKVSVLMGIIKLVS
jgi:hypothetical protein